MNTFWRYLYCLQTGYAAIGLLGAMLAYRLSLMFKDTARSAYWEQTDLTTVSVSAAWNIVYMNRILPSRSQLPHRFGPFIRFVDRCSTLYRCDGAGSLISEDVRAVLAPHKR